MRHFFGGWALGTLVYGTWLASKMRSGPLMDAYLWSAICIGPLVGIAAWGLLP